MQVIFLIPNSIGFKMIGECHAATIDRAAPHAIRAGVVLEDRYARNANGNLSHSRKELLICPIKDERNQHLASIVASCQEQLWIVDKSPDVQLWSAKVSSLIS
jgi:hypothetical protein